MDSRQEKVAYFIVGSKMRRPVTVAFIVGSKIRRLGLRLREVSVVDA